MKLAIATLALITLVASSLCAPLEVMSVCDALTRRISLNHKIVAVRGIQLATDEGAWLQGVGCGKSITVNGQEWPTFIWLEMSARRRKAAGVEAVELETSVKRINTAIAKRGFDPKRDRLWLTYVGVFETDDESGQHVDNAGAGAGQIGFGHLNAARAQLIVKGVRDPFVEHVSKVAAK